MLMLTVKLGQAVQIGEEAVIGVVDRHGSGVKLKIAAPRHKISLIASGIIPRRFIAGIAPPDHELMLTG